MLRLMQQMCTTIFFVVKCRKVTDLTLLPVDELFIGDPLHIEESVTLIGHISASLARLVQEQQALFAP
jgi:hypothetical protein